MCVPTARGSDKFPSQCQQMQVSEILPRVRRKCPLCEGTGRLYGGPQTHDPKDWPG